MQNLNEIFTTDSRLYTIQLLVSSVLENPKAYTNKLSERVLEKEKEDPDLVGLNDLLKEVYEYAESCDFQVVALRFTLGPECTIQDLFQLYRDFISGALMDGAEEFDFGDLRWKD